MHITRKALDSAGPARTPPEFGGILHRAIREVLNQPDPYLKYKNQSNETARTLLEDLEKLVLAANDPFDAALKLAIAGNIVDMGAPGGRTHNLMEFFMKSLKSPLVCVPGSVSVEKFRQEVMGAGRILYLADNAGEIVLDRLLVEMLPAGRVTVAVRSSPAINDALYADAEYAGLTQIAEVIESGSDIPGTVLSMCSDEFRDLFRSADLIISKGQGNYETLSDEDGNMYFLLMVKCPIVAEHLRCSEGDMVLAADAQDHA